MDLSRRELLTASALLLAPSRGESGSLLRARYALASGTGSLKAPRPAPIVLSSNENPYGPSPAARAAITEAITSACRYPDDDIEALVEALAKKEGLPSDHIVTATGSGELLCVLGFIHGHDGGEIIAAEPTYLELAEYAGHAG